MARTTLEREAAAILQLLGWRIRSNRELTTVTKHFQHAWMLGERLKVDGIVGPKTIAALRTSDARRRDGKSTASAHFSFLEFRCKCGGRFAACARIWVRRELLTSLEKYRAAVDAPVAIVSGCRCSKWNAHVKGAKFSQHQYGTAVDIPPVLTTTTVRQLVAFAGIGYQGSTGLVRHIDRRDVAKINPAKSTLGHPAVWQYI